MATAPSATNQVTAEPAGNGFVGPQDTGGEKPDIDKAVNSLDRALTALMEDNEAFRMYLLYKGQMHNYSWLNLLLIYGDYVDRGLDGPVCTMGYKAWKKVDRHVKAGSKAIALFKPVKTFWRTYEGVHAGTPGAKFDSAKGKFYTLNSRVQGFEIIHKTFHIQDTDGPEYDAPMPEKLEGNDALAGQVRTEVTEAAKALGIASITEESLDPDMGGLYRQETKAICLNSDNSAAQQAKTLVHELAHHVSYVLELDHHDFYHATRGAAEAVVEGAAFVVMASYGLDSSAYSVPYIARWANDLNAIRRLLRDIDKVARVIIDKLPQGAKDE